MGHLTGRSQWCGQESWKTGLGTFEMGKQNVMCFKMRIYIKDQFYFYSSSIFLEMEIFKEILSCSGNFIKEIVHASNNFGNLSQIYLSAFVKSITNIQNSPKFATICSNSTLTIYKNVYKKKPRGIIYFSCFSKRNTSRSGLYFRSNSRLKSYSSMFGPKLWAMRTPNDLLNV